MRIGIIGCGGITAFAHLPGIQNSDGEQIEIAYLCDLNARRVEHLRTRYRLGGARQAEWSEIVEDPTVGAVIVASWPSDHTASGLAAIAAGKHVLLQKPVSLSSTGAGELVRAAESSTRNILALPLVDDLTGIPDLKSIVDEDVLGPISFARVRVTVPGPRDYHRDIRNFFGEDAGLTDSVLRPEYADGAGCAGDLGPYALAVINHLFGECRVKAVFKSSPRFETTCQIVLEARNPSAGSNAPFDCLVELGWHQFPSDELCVIAGDRGTAVLSPAGALSVRPDSSRNSGADLVRGHSILPPSPIAAQRVWLTAITEGREAAFHHTIRAASWTAGILEKVRLADAGKNS